MAITAPNAVYVGQAGVPAFSGQIIASGGTDQVELAYKGTATFTLDDALAKMSSFATAGGAGKAS